MHKSEAIYRHIYGITLHRRQAPDCCVNSENLNKDYGDPQHTSNDNFKWL